MCIESTLIFHIQLLYRTHYHLLNPRTPVFLYQTWPTMAPTLPPMPLPGLIIVPGWTAQHQETFLMKNEDTPKGKCQSLVSYLTPEGKAGAPFLQIKEEESDVILFRTMEGQEAMRINVERHNIKLKTEYRALRSADAKAIWDVHLRISWRVPKWGMPFPRSSLLLLSPFSRLTFVLIRPHSP